MTLINTPYIFINIFIFQAANGPKFPWSIQNVYKHADVYTRHLVNNFRFSILPLMNVQKFVFEFFNN